MCESGAQSMTKGKVMDMVVQKRRDTGAAVGFLRRLLKNQRVEPEVIVTDGLRPFGAALQRLGLSDRHRPGRFRDNNRAENSHLGIRRHERKSRGFKSRASAQRFLEAHAAFYNTFNRQKHLLSRGALCVLRARADSVWSRRSRHCRGLVESAANSRSVNLTAKSKGDFLKTVQNAPPAEDTFNAAFDVTASF